MHPSATSTLRPCASLSLSLLAKKDAYGSRELQVDDSLAGREDTAPVHTSMSGIHFGEPVCPPPTRCFAESGTQWGQAAAERE